MSLACLVAGGAQAQQLDNYVPTNLPGYDVMPGVTVTSRLRPEYDPLGIRLGSVLIHPEIDQSLGYDQNVLGASDAHGSPVVNTDASVHAATDWSRGNLVLNLDVSRFGYPNLPQQTYTNWSAGGGWSYEIGEDTLAIGLNHNNLNQLPSGIDSIGLLKPLSYEVNSARISYKATRGAWTFVPILDFAATRFDSASGVSIVNVPVNNLGRNVETASLTTFYEFATQRSAVVVLRGTTAQYQAGQPRPDYDDVSVLVGLDYNLTGVLRFRTLVGYEIRDYRSSQISNHTAPVIEGTAIWTPTGLTTVTASIQRRIEDANEAVQTGYTFTQARLVVDHEYLRNVLLQGQAWVERADYLTANDEQTLFGVGASVTYLLNRNLRLVGTYGYSNSQTNIAQSSGYSRNVVLVQLRLAI